MDILIIIVSVIVCLSINFIIADAFYDSAQEKGYDSKKYFWYSFLFGLVGYLLVISLPDKTATTITKNEND